MQARLRQLITPQRVVYLAAFISALGIAVTLFYTRNTSTPSYSVVAYTPISQNVTGGGTVKAAQSVDLAFQSSGRITKVNVVVGDHVLAGDVLASLSSSDTGAQYAQAKAALAIQEAKMQSVLAGTRPESIAVSQSNVLAAQNNVDQARAQMIAFANDAYIKADDAVRNKADLILTNPRSNNPTLNLIYADSRATQDLLQKRIDLENTLIAYRDMFTNLSTDPEQADIKNLVTQTQELLDKTNSYLGIVGNTMSEAMPSGAYPLSLIQSYTSLITTARSTISADMSALAVAQANLSVTQSALKTAQAQLILSQASSTPADVAAQQAQVDVARANLSYAAAQIGKTLITAPMNGVITRSDVRVGGTANQGVALISMNSDAAFQIEMRVSERDMAMIRVGDSSTVSLDALQDTTGFSAHVISIDPAATVDQGVSSYKITLSFDNDDARIAAGETGTVTINTAKKDRVLSVPSSAVIQRNGKYFVMKKTPQGTLLTPVTLGITSNTITEVVSGLSEGDRIQSFGVQE